jgi:hypothetical protein
VIISCSTTRLLPGTFALVRGYDFTIMIWTKALLAVGSISLVSASADNAVDSSILHESRRAVTPTGTQIGVNPVEIDPTQTKVRTVIQSCAPSCYQEIAARIGN